MTLLQRLLFRWLIFYKGIRFYETSLVPKSPEFQLVSFETVHGKTIEFYFFREICEDVIYKRGIIFKEKFIGYVIQAKFDDEMPDHLKRFNNLKFFFNSKNFTVKDEKVIAKKFLEIYLDFIKSEVKKR